MNRRSSRRCLYRFFGRCSILPVECPVGVFIFPVTFPLVGFPVAVIHVAVVIVHGALSLLVVAEPQAFVFVVVHEIIYAMPVLLVLKPFAFVFFSVREFIHAVSLAFCLSRIRLHKSLRF